MTDHLTSSTARTGAPHPDDGGDCEPADRVTKSLLGYGVIAGPVYIVVALAQPVTVSISPGISGACCPTVPTAGSRSRTSW
jgi:hypothetical protein